MSKNCPLVRQPAVVLAVPPAQFIHQMLEMGWEARSFGTQALPQPFAHGVADRSAGLAIDPFAVVGDSAVHDGVPLCVHFNDVMLHQVIAMEIVSRQRRIACLLVKIA